MVLLARFYRTGKLAIFNTRKKASGWLVAPGLCSIFENGMNTFEWPLYLRDTSRSIFGFRRDRPERGTVKGLCPRSLASRPAGRHSCEQEESAQHSNECDREHVPGLADLNRINAVNGDCQKNKPAAI